MEQRLNAGGILDLLTKDELAECMGHNFDDAIRELYRGVDYLSFTGNGQGAVNYTIPYYPESGYTWSVKLLSANINANEHLWIFVGTTPLDTGTGTPAFTAPVGYQASDFGLGYAIQYWSSNQLVIKDNQQISLHTDSVSGIGPWMLRVLQVPTEMQGKL